MKKAVYIVISLIAFTLGVSVYYVRPLFVPISLSELRADISRYKDLKIKVVGKLEVSEAESVYHVNLKDWENDCSGDNFCFRSLELSKELIAENISLLKEIVEKNKTVGDSTLINDIYLSDGEYYIDVEVTGRLKSKMNISVAHSMAYK